MNAENSKLDQIFSLHRERSDQYLALLPKTGDVSLVVLKGHLIIEEMLFEIAASHCAHRSSLEKAKLTFAQLLSVTQALVKLPIGDGVWPAIASLNSIRNALVHNLHPAELGKKIHALQVLCTPTDQILPKDYVPPSDSSEIAASCVSYIMGALSVIGPVAEAYERGHFGSGSHAA